MKNSSRLVYRELKERINSQFETIENIKNKAGTMLGFMAVILTLFFSIKQNHSLSYNFLFSLIFLLISIMMIIYIFSAAKFRADPKPRNLYELYTSEKEEKTINQLSSNFVESYESNEIKINYLATISNISLIILFLSLLFFVLDYLSNYVHCGVII